MELSIKKAYEFIVNQYAPAYSKDAGFSDLITSEKLYKVFLSNCHSEQSSNRHSEQSSNRHSEQSSNRHSERSEESHNEEKPETSVPSLQEFETTLQSKGYQYMLVASEKNWMIK